MPDTCCREVIFPHQAGLAGAAGQQTAGDRAVTDRPRAFRSCRAVPYYSRAVQTPLERSTVRDELVTVVDLGVGNIGSIVNMCRRAGLRTEVASTGQQIERAAKLIIPGVGHWDVAARSLDELGLRRSLDGAHARKVPSLGICLGMQLLFASSEEGERDGLGWIPGRVRRFKFAGPERLRVPHMGWNLVHGSREKIHSCRPCPMPPASTSPTVFTQTKYLTGVLLRCNYGAEFPCVDRSG